MGCTSGEKRGGHQAGEGQRATLLMYVYRGSPPRNMIQCRLRKGLEGGGVDLRVTVVSKNTAGFGKKYTIGGAGRGVT